MTGRARALTVGALTAWLMLARLGFATVSAGPAGSEAMRLRAYVEMQTRLGPRPSGSEASVGLAEMLARTLRQAGCDVRVTEGVGWSAVAGTGGRARKVVGWLPPTDAPATRDPTRTASLLASHYDTVVDGPGDADNAASVAALLSAAEKLGCEPL